MRTKNVIQKTVRSAALCAVLLATSAHAAVPGLINYQGRLADANGAPVTGSKNFTLSIYDGETEGSLLYSEDIGAVTLDDNGVYSFQFGESGTSQATATKSVGVADGIKNVFNTVLPDSAMGVSSIGDGTYTWTPTNGSSSPTSFIGSYDAASKTASAIYIGAVPEAGTEISVNYQNSSGGIAEALGSGLEHWLELSIDGANQASRTKILAVPFASVAAYAKEGIDSESRSLVRQLAEALAYVADMEEFDAIRPEESTAINNNMFGSLYEGPANIQYGGSTGSPPAIFSDPGVEVSGVQVWYGQATRPHQGGYVEFEYVDGLKSQIEWQDPFIEQQKAILNPRPTVQVTKITGYSKIEWWWSGTRSGNELRMRVIKGGRSRVTWSVGRNYKSVLVTPKIDFLSQIQDPSVTLHYADGRSDNIQPGTFISPKDVISKISFTGVANPQFNHAVRKVSVIPK